MKHSIFLTYNHEIVGVGMKWLVQKHFPLSSVSVAQSFQRVLIDLPKRPYDLVVLDTEIAGGTHLLGAVERIKVISPNTRILILSELDELIYAPKYLAFGVNGYLAKKADVGSIVSAIESALDGSAVDVTGHVEKSTFRKCESKANAFMRLSKRESQIANLLIDGRPLTEIGKLMNLKETTISTYKKRIFQKIGVSTLSDLIALSRVYA